MQSVLLARFSSKSVSHVNHLHFWYQNVLRIYLKYKLPNTPRSYLCWLIGFPMLNYWMLLPIILLMSSDSHDTLQYSNSYKKVRSSSIWQFHPTSCVHSYHHLFLSFVLLLPVLGDQFCIKPSPRMRMLLLMRQQIYIWFLSAKMEIMQVGFMTPKFGHFLLHGCIR